MSINKHLTRTLTGPVNAMKIFGRIPRGTVSITENWSRIPPGSMSINEKVGKTAKTLLGLVSINQN